eukprot:snap_masked-scaffold_8-processed-gene-2.28-mRNA-1 protein AED:1.00 eAED:1.00 QI:0/0/0/0/1/1/3/0/1784
MKSKEMKRLQQNVSCCFQCLLDTNLLIFDKKICVRLENLSLALQRVQRKKIALDKDLKNSLRALVFQILENMRTIKFSNKDKACSYLFFYLYRILSQVFSTCNETPLIVRHYQYRRIIRTRISEYKNIEKENKVTNNGIYTKHKVSREKKQTKIQCLEKRTLLVQEYIFRKSSYAHIFPDLNPKFEERKQKFIGYRQQENFLPISHTHISTLNAYIHFNFFPPTRWLLQKQNELTTLQRFHRLKLFSSDQKLNKLVTAIEIRRLKKTVRTWKNFKKLTTEHLILQVTIWLQRNYRGNVAREELLFYTRKSKIVQSFCRMISPRMRLRKKKYIVIWIQRNRRGQLVRRMVALWHCMATEIQKVFRKYTKICWYADVRNKVLQLSAVWRGAAIRIKFLKIFMQRVVQLNKKLEATLTLQRSWRWKLALDVLRRKKSRKILEEVSALAIQRFWYCAQKTFPTFVLLRCLYLFDERDRVVEFLSWKERRRESATLAQSIWRYFVARKRCRKIRFRNFSSSIIVKMLNQNMIKLKLSRFYWYMKKVRLLQRWLKPHYARKLKALLIIKNFLFKNLFLYPQLWVRRRLLEIESILLQRVVNSKIRAVCIIQQVVRCFIANRRVKKIKNAIILQRFFLKEVAKNLFNLLKTENTYSLACFIWREYIGLCINLSKQVIYSWRSEWKAKLQRSVRKVNIGLKCQRYMLFKIRACRSIRIVRRFWQQKSAKQIQKSIQQRVQNLIRYKVFIGCTWISDLVNTRLTVLKEEFGSEQNLFNRFENMKTITFLTLLGFEIEYSNKLFKNCDTVSMLMEKKHILQHHSSKGSIAMKILMAAFNSREAPCSISRFMEPVEDKLEIQELFLSFFPGQVSRARNFATKVFSARVPMVLIESHLQRFGDNAKKAVQEIGSIINNLEELKEKEVKILKQRLIMEEVFLFFMQPLVLNLPVNLRAPLLGIQKKISFFHHIIDKTHQLNQSISGCEYLFVLENTYWSYAQYLKIVNSHVTLLQSLFRRRTARKKAYLLKAKAEYLRSRDLKYQWKRDVQNRAEWEFKRILKKIPRLNASDGAYTRKEWFAAIKIQCFLRTISCMMLLKKKKLFVEKEKKDALFRKEWMDTYNKGKFFVFFHLAAPSPERNILDLGDLLSPFPTHLILRRLRTQKVTHIVKKAVIQFHTASAHTKSFTRVDLIDNKDRIISAAKVIQEFVKKYILEVSVLDSAVNPRNISVLKPSSAIEDISIMLNALPVFEWSYTRLPLKYSWIERITNSGVRYLYRCDTKEVKAAFSEEEMHYRFNHKDFMSTQLIQKLTRGWLGRKRVFNYLKTCCVKDLLIDILRICFRLGLMLSPQQLLTLRDGLRIRDILFIEIIMEGLKLEHFLGIISLINEVRELHPNKLAKFKKMFKNGCSTKVLTKCGTLFRKNLPKSLNNLKARSIAYRESLFDKTSLFSFVESEEALGTIIRMENVLSQKKMGRFISNIKKNVKNPVNEIQLRDYMQKFQLKPSLIVSQVEKLNIEFIPTSKEFNTCKKTLIRLIDRLLLILKRKHIDYVQYFPKEPIKKSYFILIENMPKSYFSLMETFHCVFKIVYFDHAAYRIQQLIRCTKNTEYFRLNMRRYMKALVCMQCFVRVVLAMKLSKKLRKISNSDWKQIMDKETGMFYYINVKFNVSQWAKPECTYTPHGWWTRKTNATVTTTRGCKLCAHCNGKAEFLCSTCSRESNDDIYVCSECLERDCHPDWHPFLLISEEKIRSCMICGKTEESNLFCIDCDEDFCKRCFENFHRKGKRSLHITSSLI